jgi:aspartyl-tRNA(Asn)/glutamyl-tRNA(Gln) amidotransferase subunit C
MNIDKETVERIAHLSRLEFNEDEKAKLAKDMTAIVDWMGQLNELDTIGVEPLIHISTELNVLRADVALPSLPHSEALANAPKHDGDYFRVPKVIE